MLRNFTRFDHRSLLRSANRCIVGTNIKKCIEKQPCLEIYDGGVGDQNNPDRPQVLVRNSKDSCTPTNDTTRSSSVKGGLVRIKYAGKGTVMLSYYPRLMRETKDNSKRSIDITHRHSVKLRLEHIGGLVCVSEGRIPKIHLEVKDDTQEGANKYVTILTYERVNHAPSCDAVENLKSHKHRSGTNYILSVQTSHQAKRSLEKGSMTLSKPNLFFHGFEIRFDGYYTIMWHRFLESSFIHGLGF